ncbi:MAG: hypothetical protein ACK5VI_02360 [Opitutia bacterium]|jgi:hypothetical protein
MNPAESAVAKALGDRLGGAGKVLSVALGRGSARITLELRGQPAPVEVFAEGLAWRPDGDHLVVSWETAGSSLEWADILIREAGRRCDRQARIPDSLRLTPLKLLLPRA